MNHSLLQLNNLLTSKQCTPKELVMQYIERIEKKNSSINALARTRFDKAIYESQTIDYSKTKYGGIPILLKDLGQELNGEINSSASVLLQHYRSKHTDYFVGQLLQLGFIVLGQTTTPEFGFKNYTQSNLFGTTKNPVNSRYHVGGSSGGSAAAVASGMIPIATASDGGGSIRIPASWSGLIGLKPTRGRFLVGPTSYRSWQGASSHFIYTKKLSDIEQLFYDMQTEQMESPFVLPLVKKSNYKKFKIAYTIQSPVGTLVNEDAKQGVLKVATLLEKMGHYVEESNISVDGNRLIRSYYMMNSVETVAMLRRIEKGLARPLGKKDMEVQSYLMYLAGLDIDGATYSQLLSDWDMASAKAHQFHQTYDILVTPATNGSAPLLSEYGVEQVKLNYHMQHIKSYSSDEKIDMVSDLFASSLEKTPFNFLFNLTGQPAISLPLYKSANGMPMGIQLSAAKGNEPLLFEISKQLEQYFIDTY